MKVPYVVHAGAIHIAYNMEEGLPKTIKEMKSWTCYYNTNLDGIPPGPDKLLPPHRFYMEFVNDYHPWLNCSYSIDSKIVVRSSSLNSFM